MMCPLSWLLLVCSLFTSHHVFAGIPSPEYATVKLRIYVTENIITPNEAAYHQYILDRLQVANKYLRDNLAVHIQFQGWFVHSITRNPGESVDAYYNRLEGRDTDQTRFRMYWTDGATNKPRPISTGGIYRYANGCMAKGITVVVITNDAKKDERSIIQAILQSIGLAQYSWIAFAACSCTNCIYDTTGDSMVFPDCGMAHLEDINEGGYRETGAACVNSRPDPSLSKFAICGNGLVESLADSGSGKREECDCLAADSQCRVCCDDHTCRTRDSCKSAPDPPEPPPPPPQRIPDPPAKVPSPPPPPRPTPPPAPVAIPSQKPQQVPLQTAAPAATPAPPPPASQTPTATSPNRPSGAPVTTTSKPPQGGNQFPNQQVPIRATPNRNEANAKAKGKGDNKKWYIVGGLCGLAVIGILIVAAIAAIVINKKRAKRRLQLDQPHPSLAMGQKPKSGIGTHSTRSTRSGIHGKRGKDATELPVSGGTTEFFSK
jgi:hypothetical protein